MGGADPHPPIPADGSGTRSERTLPEWPPFASGPGPNLRRDHDVLPVPHPFPPKGHKSECDRRIEELKQCYEQLTREKDVRIGELRKEKETQIEELTRERDIRLAERDSKIEVIKEEKDARIEELRGRRTDESKSSKGRGTPGSKRSRGRRTLGLKR